MRASRTKCKNQDEIDEYWNKHSQAGTPSQCGWLKDKYGLSWQIVPASLGDMMLDKDPSKSERVMEALMNMKKLDVRALEDAYEGKAVAGAR